MLFHAGFHARIIRWTFQVTIESHFDMGERPFVAHSFALQLSSLDTAFDFQQFLVGSRKIPADGSRCPAHHSTRQDRKWPSHSSGFRTSQSHRSRRGCHQHSFIRSRSIRGIARRSRTQIFRFAQDSGSLSGRDYQSSVELISMVAQSCCLFYRQNVSSY